ncbi:hypothetical protein [Porphyrobacter sp. AAP60]|uniref:hypothetical protein n=1 Tax=Porphyrobacter sp. AAP60 TaxID=1523423 RepID=UPI0006B9BD6A|nr:hypothetical protein [Porphyrobacter sp. AAP60]KPF63922.1 hypothetical protein IP79_08965 [Porphyrobacter sp. AAP60]
MTRLLNWLWNRALLYALLVAVAAFLALAWPGAGQMMQLLDSENRSYAEITGELQAGFAAQQQALPQRVAAAKALPSGTLEQHIAQRQRALEAAEKRRDAAESGWFSAYRPSQIIARSRADIEIAAMTSELAALGSIAAPRKSIEQAQGFFAANPTMPTAGAITAARTRCAAARQRLEAFKAQWRIEQGLREVIRQERTELAEAAAQSCELADTLQTRRDAALAARQQMAAAQAALAAVQAEPLAENLIGDAGRVTLRDILIEAFTWLIAATLIPFAYRVIAYHVLAPMAARWPPMRFGAAGTAPPTPGNEKSAVSATITLGPDDEALVRQDYLQSSSLTGAKRTRWLLDWGHPLTSFASGMRFLTAVRGAGERVTVSAVKDPFAELAVLAVPEGAACVLRPSALAGVVQSAGQPLRITSHWRIFSLPALLTWQWRYLAFHGPARLVVKGGRGVRIEPAARGRIVGEGQLIGFSAGLAYAVIRSETFWPYFFGREVLLKDRLEAGDGVVLIEEAPLAGRSGIRRGFEGMADAVLKLGGI